ncbi:unnamed protein product [Arctia plantaginis]|uniref:Uncharacterized protein n=1 Tax=Arctia plantaginis TaxID=874455 RepID=A0A8S0YYA7_ARCPL|nr:unnamed protein product [Arctia plantaginis]
MECPQKTNAERQKAYRERLEKDKPSKYGELRVKHLEKVKEKYQKEKKKFLHEEEKTREQSGGKPMLKELKEKKGQLYDKTQ